MPATRCTTTIAITGAALVLTLGTAMPALADPGNGNGSGASNGNAPSDPPGQVKKTEPTAVPTATATPTHVAPGQAKKSAPVTKSNSGKAKGAGNGNSGGNGGGQHSGATKPTHLAPGQAKKAASSNAGGNGNGNGKGNAGGNGNGNAGGNGNGANGPAGHNPPGNNGTVKIHALPGDPGHHNVAHPGCGFAVDFWGFDAGQSLSVSFTGQAPTGMGTPLSLSGTGTSVTSPDDAGGGNDPDGELVFTPTAAELSVLGAPAHQGYHVRLTVATGQGGGKKQKVFWISPCAPAAPGMPAPADTPELSTDTPTLATDSDVFTAVRNGPVEATPQLDSARPSQTTPRLFEASPPVSTLPFTGANLSTLIASGVIALLVGTAITLAVRRRHKIG